ncbi:MAG: glycosyltransferase [Acidobacteriia bacterium]|nr:glycosyltransferase [Terriglobia bacterium]
MTILVLCREDNLCNTLACYARALRRRGVRLVCMETGFPFNGALQDCLSLCPEHPSLILHPEADVPYLPWGLAKVDIPTACFQVDTYAYTQRRIAWSMLFDQAIVFHPGYDALFQKAGHPGACFFAHAVEAELFGGAELERIFDVGWVGQVNGPMYGMRGPVLSALAQAFRMNELARRYTLQEMARVYRQSKIVVNIGRDDYPQDANLRTFEAMAAGALLITALPSELTQIGFEDGVHFLGYRDTGEITFLVRKYLDDEPARKRIAEAGREKVLREHTYDVRVEKWLERAAQDAGKLQAPARHWPEGRVRRIYLDYFAANGALAQAAAELPKIARHNLKDALIGAALLGRAGSKRLAAKLRPRSQPA